MLSFFGLEMENYQGDLADIVRAGGRALARRDEPVSSWDFPAETISLSASMEDNRDSIFGDPFCNMRDPLLHELNVAGLRYFSSSNSPDMLSTATRVEDTTTSGAVLAHHHRHHKVFEEGMDTSPCNVFSRIQISPNNPTRLPDSSPPVTMATASSPRCYKPSVAVSSDMISSNSSKGCLIDNSGQVQISSPRNLGIKRRKSQAKKVVCIPAPAPAAASNRTSGEVVPSDLWAWRKYGQKPIKGSPYPRGYYRCSSSKGCSARKQVERSRSDPTMLVITYTSEHNHPWPTQRNALAGSTRSQPPKNNAGGTKSSSTSQVQKSTSTNTKEEQKESSNDTLSPTISAAAGGASCSTAVKEEIDQDTEKQMEMYDNEYNQELPQSYRPAMPDSSQSDDFFADLCEIEADPLDHLFTQGFIPEQQKERKALDPFSIFDWSGSGENSSSFGEAQGGL